MNTALAHKMLFKPEVREARYGLTKRERQILESIVTGKTNRELSSQLSISEQTVKHHVSHIYDKLGVSSRLELLLFAIHHRLIQKSGESQ